MDTAPQTAGTNTNDTGTAASATPDTLLTAPPAASAPSEPAADTQPPASAEGQGDSTTKPAEAPADYGDFTMPEGMTLDTEALAEFKELAKGKAMTQEEAQKFADVGAKLVQKAQAEYASKIEAVQAQWAEASRTDKEFGGDKIAENMALAKRALDTFGTPELSKMLAESKLGNNPEIVRVFYRIGKAISEDKLVPGNTRPATAVDPAKKLFPSMN